MHWFDRVSKQAAEGPSRTTRRTLLKGATLATVALPFVPDAIAHASRAVPYRDTNAKCEGCYSRVNNEAEKNLSACSPAKTTPKPKGSSGAKPAGGGKAKSKPSAAARRAACQAKARKKTAHDLNGCRQVACADIEPIRPPVAPEGGHEACPAGTTKCGATLCCFGGDSCCPCGLVDEGLICCAPASSAAAAAEPGSRRSSGVAIGSPDPRRRSKDGQAHSRLRPPR